MSEIFKIKKLIIDITPDDLDGEILLIMRRKQRGNTVYTKFFIKKNSRGLSEDDKIEKEITDINKTSDIIKLLGGINNPSGLANPAALNLKPLELVYNEIKKRKSINYIIN